MNTEFYAYVNTTRGSKFAQKGHALFLAILYNSTVCVVRSPGNDQCDSVHMTL